MDMSPTPPSSPRCAARPASCARSSKALVAAHPDVFEEVRGAGLMLGLKCKPANTDVVTAGYDAQVITVPAADNVVRLLPPLTITEDEIAEALARLDRGRLQPRPPPDLHLRVQYSGGPGAEPPARRPERRSAMTHFLDIHKTDPAALRQMIDSRRRHETRARPAAPRARPTTTSRSQDAWSR